MKPKIGIMPLFDVKRDSYWMVPGYMQMLEEAGALPVMFPLTTDEGEIFELCELCSGFLFTGGQDVSPKLYGSSVSEKCGEICSDRDVMEKVVFFSALLADKPVFGICRGLQLINVLLGGTLYQDLPAELGNSLNHCQRPPYDTPSHNVSLLDSSALHGLLNQDTLYVNSCHHQGVKRLAGGLVPVALAEDGLVEAACMPDRRFVFAVQWHPELMYRNDRDTALIIRQFVQACSKDASPDR